MRIESRVVPSSKLAPVTPAQVAREFRRALDAGASLEPAGSASKRPRSLLSQGYTPKFKLIVIDEAQNCTYGQIKMLLTRLGWHSTMVVTGDPDQTDLLPGVSGLADIAGRVERVPGVGAETGTG